MRLFLTGVAVAVPFLACGAPAHAQVGISANAQSEYRYRGRPLSESQPIGGLNLSYDHPSGAYAGGSATGIATEDHGLQPFGYTAYAGYGRRAGTPGGLALDFGVVHSKINYYRFTRRSAAYSEVYAGVLSDRASLRVYYSPDYFGQGLKTVYADLSGSLRPGDDWRVFAHLGALAAVEGRFQNGARQRFDMSLGTSRRIRDVQLSLSYIRGAQNRVQPDGKRQARGAIVAGATYLF